MQIKLIFLVCLTLILSDVKGNTICHCYCCRSIPCVPIYVGSLPIADVCNSTTCNQNVCFGYNTTQCPAVGSPGNVSSICSTAYSIFRNFDIVPMIITLIFFLMKFYQ